MATDYESNNKVSSGWEGARNLIGVGLLMVLSYQMGVGHGRSAKTLGEYSALRTQYQRIETEYSTLKAEYDRIEPQYAALRDEYKKTETQYAALKAQYDRIEAKRTGTKINQQNQ